MKSVPVGGVGYPLRQGVHRAVLRVLWTKGDRVSMSRICRGVGALSLVVGAVVISSGVVRVSAAGGALVSVVPARLLETRVGPGEKTVDHLFEGIGQRAAGSVLELTVAGRGGVPGDAAAVLLNVTAVAPAGSGYLTVWPCGEPQPLASNVNYVAGDVVPNAVLAKVGAGGKVCVFTLAATDIIADVNGFVPAGGSPSSVVPARLLETRVGPGEKTVDHLFEGIGQRAAGSVLELTVAGRGGVPGDAAAVLLNVTAVAGRVGGIRQCGRCGEPQPLASNVNYVAGDVVPYAVLAKVGAGAGKVRAFTLAATDIIADVNGFVAGGWFAVVGGGGVVVGDAVCRAGGEDG